MMRSTAGEAQRRRDDIMEQQTTAAAKSGRSRVSNRPRAVAAERRTARALQTWSAGHSEHQSSLAPGITHRSSDRVLEKPSNTKRRRAPQCVAELRRGSSQALKQPSYDEVWRRSKRATDRPSHREVERSAGAAERRVGRAQALERQRHREAGHSTGNDPALKQPSNGAVERSSYDEVNSRRGPAPER